MIPLDTLQNLDKGTLIELNLKLSAELQVLTEKIALLESRLDKNSNNSNKPPSSDGYRKPNPKSLRKKTGKKSGGQAGHKGETLKQVAHPDKKITHGVTHCGGCGHDMADVVGKPGEKRQVFDVPKPKLEVTEHVSEVKCCPYCNHVTKGHFPDDVAAPVQYGTNIRATAIYMMYQQLLPEARLVQWFLDIYGVSLCGATLAGYGQKIYDNLEAYEESAEKVLIAGKSVHFDETGTRVQKALWWLHSASTALVTIYKIHQKRGLAAMENFPVHKQFQGIACHDHWKPYFKLSAKAHALCNSHICRELVGLHEREDGPGWAKEMEAFLLKAHLYTCVYQEDGKLPDDYLEILSGEYDTILRSATFHYDEQHRQSRKKPPGESLFVRLEQYKTEILRFMHDFDIPFSNNQAEQDIRMEKVRQKISGCFRSTTGPEVFCRIRGYLSTARKHGFDLFDAICDAVSGNPIILTA